MARRACDDHIKPKDGCHNCRIINSLGDKMDAYRSALDAIGQTIGYPECAFEGETVGDMLARVWPRLMQERSALAELVRIIRLDDKAADCPVIGEPVEVWEAARVARRQWPAAKAAAFALIPEPGTETEGG